MRTSRLIILWFAGACGSDASRPPAPCEAASDAPGAPSEVGLGSDFTPVAEGQDVELELGSQGLWMFVVNARVRDTDARAGDLVGVTATAALAQTGEPISLEVSCRVRELAPAPGGYLQLASPYLLPMHPSFTAQLDGANVTLGLEVRDAEGRRAEDARAVVTHLPAQLR